MLTAAQIDALPDPIMELYEEYMQSVINDIARRLADLDFARPTAAWQMQRLIESGKVHEAALEELSRLTGKSEATLRTTFEKAGVKAMRFDDSVYRAAGLNPLPLNLSPAMAQVLAAGLRKTQGLMQNLTLTTAAAGQDTFIAAADRAYLEVSSGAFDYITAIRQAVKGVASQGLTVISYPTGHRDQLDVAMRRTVLTGVNQTVGHLQMARADEMGQDLVQVSAHAGARNTGTGPANHESWQGKIYSRSAPTTQYPGFVETTGYGTGPGLMGWNCVLGDTLVSGPAICAAYRREYSGEIIIIQTSSGKELAITPNHPVLTDHGWVAAGLLAEGDNVISHTGFDGPSSISPNINESEPRIQDVFDALSVKWNMFRFPVSSGYFHGDISDSEVDVVFPDSFLWNSCDSTLFKEQKEVSFCNTIKFPDSLIAEGTFNEIGIGAFYTPDGIMSSFSESGASIGPGSLQSDPHGIRPTISQRNAEFDEIFPNQPLRNSNPGGNFILPQTRVVHGKKFIRGDTRLSFQIDCPVIGFGNAIPFKTILNGVEGATVFISDESKRIPRHEELDNVVFIERKYLSSTHVYNLETEYGWYFANGIVTHNCRHSWYPFFEGISENAYSEAMLNEMNDKTVTYQGKQIPTYDATQEQRGIERKIRYWKRQAGALEAAGLDNSAETAKVKQWQAQMRGFVKETGLNRQREREQI